MLQNIFQQLVQSYSQDFTEGARLWNEIKTNHDRPVRYYHNLHHLEHLFLQLEVIRDQVEDWDSLLWALFYHDFIYEVDQQNNEAQSAEYAKEVLLGLAYPVARSARCVQHILATKSHAVHHDPDTVLFTDADLSILGQAPELYQRYTQQIRREYAVFSDEVYQKGRKQVLQHFLAMRRIFKSDFFFVKYESIARSNLQTELLKLSRH